MELLLSDICKCLLLIILGISNSQFGNKFPGVEGANRMLRNADDSFGCPDDLDKTCRSEALYREFDGTCNNLEHPFWGSAGITFRRFLPPLYDVDLRLCKENNVLPKARQIVAALNSLPTKEDSKITVMAMQWGQFIIHDISLTPAVPKIECCVDCSSASEESNDCLAIDVKNDPFYKQFGIDCLENMRSVPAGALCTQEREQVNNITAYLDGSVVYGVTKATADELRTFSKGQMKVRRRGQEDLQGQSCPAAATCPFHFLPTAMNGTQEILISGEIRVNQQPSVTSMHTLFIRMHNDIARRLSQKHSKYGDEKLFQETRQIVIALMQHITFSEFLPEILPSWALDYFSLLPLSSGYFKGYDQFLDASLRNAFSAAAFRFGHSLVPNIFSLSNGKKVPLATSFLNDTLTFNPATHPSHFLNGISLQRSRGLDQNVVASLSNKLFASGPDFENGSDVYSKNIMRGRDHGLPPYMEWREFCDLPTFCTFKELETVLKPGVAKVFKELYCSVEDIDLYPAAISEKADSDGIVGPTLTCLLGQQFNRLKFGDRFYYESRTHPNTFTLDQLDSIRRTTLAALLCRYTNTRKVPQKVMRIRNKRNKLLKCQKIVKSTVLTQLEDLF